MKKILLIYTGGTICTSFDGEKRSLNTSLAKTYLLENFLKANPSFKDKAEEIFEDSAFPKEHQTLSENMTLEKIGFIAKHLASFPLEQYRGVMIMHGTDTLHFSANLFSFLFSDTPVPILFISGNRPPMDEKSNANANFRFAAEHLLKGDLPAGVFVPYRNSDLKMYLHKGRTILPCRNFSEDFFNGKEENVFCENKLPKKEVIKNEFTSFCKDLVFDSVLFISPYPGLNYETFSLENMKAVVHGTYHSGTVCVHPEGKNSLVTFSKRCKEKNIPIFLSPSSLSFDQYESVFTLTEKTGITLLDLPSFAAYAKAIVGISNGYFNEDLISFMKQNNE